jgi:hypothetical protein
MAQKWRLLAPQIRVVQILRRSYAYTLQLPVYRDGGLVGPDSGTVALLDSAGVTIFSSAVSIHGNIAQYLVQVSDISSTQELGEGYILQWDLVFTHGGETHSYTFRQPAAIARSRLYPVISDIDLEAQYSDLSSIRPSSLTSYQQYIDEAWYQIIERLRLLGNLEYLILDPQALRMPHIDLTCYLIFKDMDSSGLGEGRYLDLATEHRKNFEGGLKRINFRYDIDHDGKMDSPNTRRSAQPVIYTSAPPPWTIGYRRF